MRAQLKGRIVVQDLSYLVLDVGGVGYQVFASGRSLSQLGGIGAEVTILTELVVREDAMTLYGFARKQNALPFDYCKRCKGLGQRQPYLY